MLGWFHNAYSDEVLHVAKLSPFAIAATLDDGAVERLYIALRGTLASAVAAASGKPAKEIAFDRYGRQAGKTVLESMTIKDLLGGASTTRIEYTNYRVATIDEKLLTPEGALNF